MTATAAATNLSFAGLSVARGGRQVLRDVSITIPPGEVTALLGPNGAGKSTLVLAVGGVLRPTSGTVTLGDVELTRRRPEQIRGAGVAIVPEGRQLLPNLTVEDNLRVATYALGRAGGTQRDRACARAVSRARAALAHRHALALGRRAADGGARAGARLAAAVRARRRALARPAPIVVQRLVPTLEAVAASGVGVLLIEQFAHVALGLAQTAYVLERGRIHYHGTAQRLKDEPELLQSAYLLRNVDPGGDALETLL